MTHSSVRFRDGVWEFQCSYCREFAELSLEFWNPKVSMRRCMACMREYKRLKEAGYRQDEALRALMNARNRMRYWVNRDERIAKGKIYRDTHREQRRIYQRAYMARRRAA